MVKMPKVPKVSFSIKDLTFKNVKKFLWDYKYILILLLVLFMIYRSMNVYIQENLEVATSTTLTKPVIGIKNTSPMEIQVEIYKMEYDAAKNVNIATPIQKITEMKSGKITKSEPIGVVKIPVNSEVIIPSESGPGFPESTKNAKMYLDGGVLGFAVKASTVDGSSDKNITYELRICNEKSAGAGKVLCNLYGPNTGDFNELKDYNFKNENNKDELVASMDPNSKVWKITSQKPMQSFSYGFIYGPSVKTPPKVAAAAAATATTAVATVTKTATTTAAKATPPPKATPTKKK